MSDLDAGLVASMLDEMGAPVAAALTTRLERLEPGPWLGELAADYPRRGGKMLRPALLIATCRAFGGELDDALPSAVSLEMLHNAFLVHDDIADESTHRRGGPTLHRTAGTALALNAGDALALGALAVLDENRALLGSRLAARIGREFEVMLQHTLEGQAIELGWRRDVVVDLTDHDYLDLIMRKTCWYTTVTPLRVGALVGSWGRADPEPMIRFGFLLGAAFQIRDDLLNLTGDETRYGKELLGDLYEGKRTLMLIHLLGRLDGRERDELVGGFLARERQERLAADVAAVLELMDHHGSIDYATAYADGIAAAAYGAFDVAFAGVADGDDRRFVRELIDFMLDRDA